MFGFLTSLSATRPSHRRVPRLTSDNFMCCHTETEREDHDFSARHILTPTQPVGNGREEITHELLTRSRTLYPGSYHAPCSYSKSFETIKVRTKKSENHYSNCNCHIPNYKHNKSHQILLSFTED